MINYMKYENTVIHEIHVYYITNLLFHTIYKVYINICIINKILQFLR